MRLILVEFPWQLKKIINNKESFRKDVIVSLDPESSYILKTNKIPYFETYQFCNHKELWNKYKEITNRSIKITEVLDEALWNADKRFKDLNWKLFNDYHLPLKLSFDQLFYYSELISKLIEKFNPSEIIVADTKKVLINDYFLINTKISVIKFLLKKSENTFNKIKISFILPDQNEKSIVLFFNNFKKLIFFTFKDFLKKKIKNIYYKINFMLNYYVSKPKYLSIGCFEILKYKKLYPKESKFFISYYHNNLNKNNSINDLTFFNKFIDYLKNETSFSELLKHKNISFEFIFREILLKLLQQRNFLLDEFYKAKKVVNRIKPSCVIFQSMAPFNSANIPFKKVCVDLKIPFVIWMHGGYGLSYSLSGYDVTDFRFCKNHISYGPHLKDLIANDKCILKKLEFNENYNILPVGSPRFDYEKSKKNLNKILEPNNKKTILFLMGCLVERNHFRFGLNREKSETSLWEFHYDILCLLKKYQNKYNIIFKDYHNGYKSLWKKILRNINADKILYISNEHKVNDLLRTSDLNITPWGTTVFFEALYFDADIFVIEEDIFEELLEGDTKDEIYYFNNNKIFLLELEKYLEKGNFYTRDKKNSKNYFLQLDYLNKRNELLNKSLSSLTENSEQLFK